ncbi:MAG: sulfotransferase [Phycisphaerae bacterium]|nr:sulfotransferase [Phycisphaerae bacterium]
MSRAPHFLGIGVQKAATSWLWEALRLHPDVWMPPRKELHYFDRATRYPSPSHLASDSRWRRATSDAPEDCRLRQFFRDEFRAAVDRRDWPSARWTLRYFWGGRSDAWYRSLFAPAKGRVAGEITPAYSILDDADVARAAAISPSVKVLVLLRDPIERAWSHAKFAASLHGSLYEVPDLSSEESIVRFMDSPVQTMRGDYVRMFETWTRHLPAERFWIGYQDDVEARPDDVLRGAFEHLGVAADRAVRGNRGERVNRSAERPMPDAVRRHLASRYLPELRRLAALPIIAARPGREHVATWIRRAESAAGDQG